MALKKPQNKSSKSLFDRYGGRMTTEQINRILDQETMHPWEREYIKRVVERYHSPTSPHITKSEFQSALKEMAQNTKDPVERNRIEQLKRRFGL